MRHRPSRRDTPKRSRRGVLLPLGLAALLVAAPACGGGDGDGEAASEGETADASATDTAGATAMSPMGGGPQASAAMQEYRELNQQIQQIRQEALQDSSIGAEQAELREALMSAMQENPRTADRIERFDSLRQVLNTAREQGDTTRMREVVPQLRQLDMWFRQAQQRVLQREEIASKVDSFQDHLEVQMTEVDPRASELMARQDSLVEEIRSQAPAAARRGSSGPDTAQDGGGR